MDKPFRRREVCHNSYCTVLWVNLYRYYSLTLAGLLQSSNASKDHGKTSMDTRRLDAQTNTSFTVLPQSSLRHGEQSSFSRKSFPNQQTVSSASLSKILSPMLPPSPTPSPDLSFITDRPNISTNPANSPGTASSLSDVNTHPPRTRKRTNHLDRKSPLPSTVSPATKRPKLDDDDDNHSSSHISSNLQRKFTDLKSLLEQEKKGRIAAETQLCRLQQQLVDSGLNASQIDLLQAVGIAERDKEAYKARSKELEREIVSLKGQLEGDHSAVHRSQDRTERGKKEADILQDEIDVLRMKNKSLEEELRKFKHAPDLRNEETKALRTRIEQQRQQLEEYALRVNPNDGMSTLGVDEKRSDSSSEAAAFDQKRIIPRVKQEELDRVRRELDQERDRRVALEGIVDDMKRECRSPFIVPALVGAFAEISRLTTKVKVRIEDEKDAIEVDRRLQLDHE
ncbi:hypothetical protein GYMLUDRAFT_78229 [Collybiopsis luxurians FD-317 M1]|uniref:Uncharacterized protein n=1 Tax=Collybiopsis luxurians FD-317 M1 TaxID=944289 RepID=A0A0D0AM86_9AGAR|nr:hypothetical protein GYMLUDRAFT_78229 [Collybiopsis luxurians FD-317 M1]